jgi:FKBP-type peptidyl-prolyl cis-trans isomerase (trigger factor)
MSELVKSKELHAKPEQIRAIIEDFAASYEDPSEVVAGTIPSRSAWPRPKRW